MHSQMRLALLEDAASCVYLTQFSLLYNNILHFAMVIMKLHGLYAIRFGNAQPASWVAFHLTY